MSDKEHKEFVAALKEFKEKVTENSETSRRFLIDLGVFTEKGNLKKNYEGLCIPSDQD